MFHEASGISGKSVLFQWQFKPFLIKQYEDYDKCVSYDQFLDMSVAGLLRDTAGQIKSRCNRSLCIAR